MRPNLAALLPAGAVAEALVNRAPTNPVTEQIATALFPAEARYVADAGPMRRRDFAGARMCAHRALVRLGRPATPIMPRADGSPIWPPGIVGSLTHCPGFFAATLAHSATVTALGIDAEPNDPLSRDVLDLITVPPERVGIDRLRAAWPSVAADRLLFSAKEAVFKAWYPRGGVTLGEHQVCVALATDGSFGATIQVPEAAAARSPFRRIWGRWDVVCRTIVTVAAQPGP
ncbi:MAG: 4'-phosphopantetheinyl transferase family protein [Nocardioides sp.]